MLLISSARPIRRPQPATSVTCVAALLNRLGDAWSAVLVGCLFWAAVTALSGYALTHLA